MPVVTYRGSCPGNSEHPDSVITLSAVLDGQERNAKPAPTGSITLEKRLRFGNMATNLSNRVNKTAYCTDGP